MTARDSIPHEQLGPAERLFDLVLRSSAHPWHNRVGLEVGGAWVAAHPGQKRHPHAPKVRPGLFVPAAVELYTRLLEIYQLNAELMAHFASYALLETDWRDCMSEEEICERIARERLGYKQTVGRLPKDIGLTPAIMVALLPSLSAKDLRILTPTLEELGLLAAPQIRERWEAAMKEAADQRSLHIARRVRSRELRDRLEEAADNAVKKAVESATRDLDLHVMFLIDKSGSMQAAIAQSKEALARILAGFPSEKVHIASFDTSGTVLRPKAASRKAVEYMLAQIQAGGGTRHLAAIQPFHKAGVAIPAEAKLIVIVVGDEDGERGKELADTFRQHGYRVDAMAMIVCVASGWMRGKTVRDCAAELRVPFCELAVEQFEDPYQVPRALAAVLEAPLASVNAGTTSRLIDKIMATPVIGRDVPV